MPSPHSTTKDINQDNRLIISRAARGKQKWLFLVLFIVILVIGGRLGYEFYLEIVRRPNFSVEDILKSLALLSLITLFIFALGTQFLPMRMTQGKEQRFSNALRAFKSILLVIWGIPAIAFIGVVSFDFLFPNGLEAGIFTDWKKAFDWEFFFICLGIVIANILWLHFLYSAIRTCILAISHGTVTAVFDKADYRIGDAILVSIKERQSNNDTLDYRVHLNLVEEKVVHRGSGNSRKSQYSRLFDYSEYKDVNPPTLKEGITLQLPVDIPGKSMLTDLSKGTNPHYWEVLIEKRTGYFWARFFVEVG